MSDVVAFQALVRGRVQGVFYRVFVEDMSRKLELTGYVRNRPDGTVEVEAEGERKNLEKLVEFLKKGPPAARVEEVAVKWEEASGKFLEFNIKY